jgi:hypothetical protein
VVLIERAKIEEDPLRVFKISTVPLTFNKYEQKRFAFQRKGLEIAMFQPIAAEHFCLASNWLTAGIWAFLSSFPIPSKTCPEAIQ